MNTFVFQPGLTWRKLGYGFYSDSLSYREVLEQNPKWNVMELPPVGAVLESGTTVAGSVAGLSQQTPIFDRNTGLSTIDYYPFEGPTEYYEALSLYNPGCLNEVDRLNGWTSDSF